LTSENRRRGKIVRGIHEKGKEDTGNIREKNAQKED